MKELEKFCLPQKGKYYINIGLSIFTWAFLNDIFSVIKYSFSHKEFNGGLFSKPIFIYICIVGVYLALRDYFIKKPKERFNQMIESFQAQGIMNLVLTDFKTSTDRFWNKVIAGQYFIFVKNKILIVNYKDIVDISTYTITSEYKAKESRDTYTSVSRYIDIICSETGKHSFEINSGSKKVYQEFCELVRSKNPDVIIRPF